MSKVIKGKDAQVLLELLRRMDQDYTPTMQEETELKAITTVDFRRLGIDVLPESMRHMSALQSLNVSFNRLKVLPKFIGNLSALQSLKVSDN